MQKNKTKKQQKKNISVYCTTSEMKHFTYGRFIVKSLTYHLKTCVLNSCVFSMHGDFSLQYICSTQSQNLHNLKIATLLPHLPSLFATQVCYHYCQLSLRRLSKDKPDYIICPRRQSPTGDQNQSVKQYCQSVATCIVHGPYASLVIHW